MRWGRVGLALCIVCVASVLFQLGLPSGKTSSRASLGGIDIVSMDASQIEETLHAVEASSYIYLTVGGEQFINRYDQLGLNIDIESAKAEANYGLSDKIVPFSALVRFSNAARPLKYIFDEEKARQVIGEIADVTSTAPLPASIIAEGARVGVVPDVEGIEVDVDQSIKALMNVEYIDRQELVLPVAKREHAFNTESAIRLADSANDLISRAPTLVSSDGTSMVVPEDQLASWFTTTPYEEGVPVELALDDFLVSQYLDEVASELYKVPKPTQVSLLDGREITRVNGFSGRTLDKTKALEDLKAYFFSESFEGSVVNLNYLDVAPGLTYNKTYSATASGLSAMLADRIANLGDYTVSVTRLDRPDFHASYRGDFVSYAASTYKVYVAYYAVSKIEAGELSWTSKLPSGRQLDYCYEQMIVVSSNSCALEIRNFLGPENINQSLRKLGMPTAGFTAAGSFTSADELTLYLQLLYNGQLMNQQHTDELIALMKRQIYRTGIPAGVAPDIAADKAGFFSIYTNDTAIVYGDAGNYALTVMSRYKSKSAIASLTREIHQFMEGL